MSYSVPKQWAHEDTVAAEELQKYSDGLDLVRPLIGEAHRSWVFFNSQMPDTQEFWLVHKARWLIYKSTGEIQHPSAPETYPGVSLSDQGGICAEDLDQIDWLIPGMLYRVIGCSVCFEDEDGIIV